MISCAESLPEADFVVGFQNYAGLPATLQSALDTDLHPKQHVEKDFVRHQRVQVRKKSTNEEV